MKSIYTLLAMSLVMYSCCNGESQSDALNLHYPNLTDSVELFAIRTERTDISLVIDTVSFGELNSNNNYPFGELGFNSTSPNHIFIPKMGYIEILLVTFILN